MSYIEAFLVPVPTANKEEYRAHAERTMPLFKKIGATRVVECWGDDVKDGKVTDFRRAVKAKDDETVVFSWIEYPDKAARDAANAMMRGDPETAASMAEVCFDATRMVFSGFASLMVAGSDADMGYIDGFVIPVEKARKADYLEVAKWSAPIFMAHGTQGIVENWGDDVMKGQITDFYKAVDAGDSETVVFSWMAYPSRAVRDKCHTASMADDRFKQAAPDMPFDGKRLVMGGFVPIVDRKI